MQTQFAWHASNEHASSNAELLFGSQCCAVPPHKWQWAKDVVMVHFGCFMFIFEILAPVTLVGGQASASCMQRAGTDL